MSSWLRLGGMVANLTPCLLKMNDVLKIALIKIFKWNIDVHFVSYLVYFTRFRCAENCIPNTILSVWCCAITNQRPAILQWMSLYTNDGQPFYHRGPIFFFLFFFFCVWATPTILAMVHIIFIHIIFFPLGAWEQHRL